MGELTDTDRTLWDRVARTVTPLGERQVADPPPTPARAPLSVRPAARAATPLPRQPVQLDGGWERRLNKGVVEPDRTLDLHGLRLDGAWERLDAVLDQMVQDGGRVLLVIAGRDRGPDVRQQPGARGRIRAKLPDWLHASHHAGRIAAVRPAHRRHGGAGAVYVILRRDRRSAEGSKRG